tara:strand:+ start:534 stop:1913 length:1380 start_codon:yes stop_codon:yes gene_type:complete
MKKYIYLCLFSILLAACNSPRSLYKKGIKLQEKNLHEKACLYFTQSLDKKPDFIDANLALKTSGQRVVNHYLDEFFKAKNFQKDKEAVYHYRSATLFKKRLESYKINLEIPSHYTNDHNTLLERYLEEIYSKALHLLKEEIFDEAEVLFKEISLLKPSYKDVDDLQHVATFEPKYRSAVSFLENEKFRAAYYEFNKIPDSYKDTKSLQKIALEAGLLTIGLISFENATNQKGGEASVLAHLSDKMLKLNNPFIKLVDRTHTQILINEQIMGLSGQTTENSVVNAGELIGVKAVLTGKLISFSKTKKPIKKEVKKAWIERKVKKYNPDTEKDYFVSEYDKITYNEFYGYNEVNVSFQYQLISTETGEILLTDIIKQHRKDEVYFASANYNYRNIVPGNWKWPSRKHSSDKINTSLLQKNTLKQLFKNNQNLKSIPQLAEEIYENIAQKITQDINTFNPEN